MLIDLRTMLVSIHLPSSPLWLVSELQQTTQPPIFSISSCCFASLTMLRRTNGSLAGCDPLFRGSSISPFHAASHPARGCWFVCLPLDVILHPISVNCAFYSRPLIHWIASPLHFLSFRFLRFVTHSLVFPLFSLFVSLFSSQETLPCCCPLPSAIFRVAIKSKCRFPSFLRLFSPHISWSGAKSALMATEPQLGGQRPRAPFSQWNAMTVNPLFAFCLSLSLSFPLSFFVFDDQVRSLRWWPPKLNSKPPFKSSVLAMSECCLVILPLILQNIKSS